MEQKNKVVGRPVRKKDAMRLLLGKPAYLEDVTPLRLPGGQGACAAPHAHAVIREINTTVAGKVPGVVGIYTWQDVPQKRYAQAGQTYPEPSPYDRLILDRRVRFVGDAVAIVAAENEKAADKALKLIKVQYDVQPAVLDFHTAKDNPVLVHPEEDWKAFCRWGRTTPATCAPAAARAMAMWTVCWPTATWWWSIPTIPRRSSRP